MDHAYRLRSKYPAATVCLLGGLRFALCLFVGIPAAIAASLADSAQRPTPAVGYHLSYQGRVMGVPCADWTISEIRPDRSVVSTCRSYRLEFSGNDDFNVVRLSTMHGVKLMEFTPYAPAVKFPLAVGTRWSTPYTFYDGGTNLVVDARADCNVPAYESVTVSAGTFQAFRIDCVDTFGAGSRSVVAHTTRWYAPEVAVVIKSIQREEPDKWNFELAGYGAVGATPPPPTTLPPPSPSSLPVPVPPAVDLDKIAPILDPNDY